MIYFIQAADHAIKIGHYLLSSKRRMRAMQTGCPLNLTLLGTIKGGKESEKALHSIFAKYKLRGEWYSMHIKPQVNKLIDCLPVRRLKEIDEELAVLIDDKLVNKLVAEKERILSFDWI